MEDTLSKAERTKQFIIEKTAHVFNEKGYAGTSINDLIDATGLSRGSIYGNFENKDEVALAVFDYNFGNVIAYIKAKMEAKKTYIDKLLVYPETYRNFLKISFLKAGCPLLNTSIEADDTHPLLKEKAIKALNLWKNSIERLIYKGIETQEIKPETDATAFATVLMSLIEGAIMQAKVTNTETALDITMTFLEKMTNDLHL